MTNYFPFGLLFWIVSLLLKDYNKKEPKPTAIEPFQGKMPEKTYQYYSNGRQLFEPHIFYYFEMLQLQEVTKVTDETIQEAASKRYGLINKIEYDDRWPIASRDVNAAKAYLIDRWSYMTSLN